MLHLLNASAEQTIKTGNAQDIDIVMPCST